METLGDMILDLSIRNADSGVYIDHSGLNVAGRKCS